MFNLTLLDHLRLTFGHVVYSHKVHTEQATRLARLTHYLRTALLALMLSTLGLAVMANFGWERVAMPAVAVLAGLSLGLFVYWTTSGTEGLSQAHRVCSVKLWVIRERYRALLADLADNRLTPEAARDERDALMRELHAIYDDAPLTDASTYQTARQSLSAAGAAALSDEEIDQFLPEPLRKTVVPVTPNPGTVGRAG